MVIADQQYPQDAGPAHLAGSHPRALYSKKSKAVLTNEQKIEISQAVESKLRELLTARELLLTAAWHEGSTYDLRRHFLWGGLGEQPDPSTALLAERPTATDPLEPLVRVIARAVEVLGTSEKALRWINAPVRSLGDQTPASLLGSPEGIQRVEDALGSIEHGVW
jgi:hypothetical protein